MNNPGISIVMCTYNGENYIDEQLQSILNQTLPAKEIIIVDDASTDNTYLILEKWRDLNPQIQLFRNEGNMGFNKNFEKAISLASYNYISIADQDDIWMPRKNQLLAEALNREKEITLVHCRSAKLLHGKLVSPELKFLHHHFKGSDTRAFIFYNHINGHSMMFKRSLLPLIIPVPHKMYYDWWIAVIASSTGVVASVDAFLVHHRIHETNSYFNTKNSKMEPDRDEIIRAILTCQALSADTVLFAKEMLNLLEQKNLKARNASFRLFSFFFKNRKIIFGHKKRKFPIFSHFKNAVKYAKANYKNTGVSF